MDLTLSPNIENAEVSIPSIGSLRIVHVVSSLKVGGMEQFVVRIALAQRNRGHRVSILSFGDGPLRSQAQRQGLDVFTLQSSNKIIRVLRGAIYWLNARPDIIHAHNSSSLHYAILGKRISRAKAVMTNHGQSKGSRQPSLNEWRRVDSVIAVSEAVANRMKEPAIYEKLSVIHNGVEIQKSTGDRQAIRSSLGLDGRFVGIIVARIDSLKGHDALLKACALLKRDALPITILIAGDGEERARLERFAKELGLRPDEARFLGFRSDIPQLLAASDFFALPSLAEGLPLSVLEAMARQLPVIATPVGGVPEIISDNENGLLVPVDDSEALSKAIARLFGDRKLRERLSAASVKRVETAFSFETMTERYETLYASLL